MITILVACDPDGVIGRGNTIPWHLPEDLKLFKERTVGHSVVMGRLTWESLPRRPLPGRVNYVVSTRPAPCMGHRCLEDTLCGPIWCDSLGKALDDAAKNCQMGQPCDTFVIGGQQIYELALNSGRVGRIVMSRLHDRHEGDRYFHLPPEWEVEAVESRERFDVVCYRPQR